MKNQILCAALLCLSLTACTSMQSDDEGGVEQMEMVSGVSDQELEAQLDKPSSKPVPTTLPEQAAADEIEPPATIPVPTPVETPAPDIQVEKEPAVPAVAKAPKPQKTDVKFYWKKNTVSAKASFKEEKKTTKVSFSGPNIKKGLYTMMVEDSCKKSKKNKPKKLVSFNVKKNGKFSDSSTAKATKYSSLKGKVVVLYFGPKAKTRLDCAPISK